MGELLCRQLPAIFRGEGCEQAARDGWQRHGGEKSGRRAGGADADRTRQNHAILEQRPDPRDQRQR